MAPITETQAATDLPEPPTPDLEPPPTPGHDDRPAHLLDIGDSRARGRPLRRRLLVVGLLAAPVVALAAVPAMRFSSWQWWSLGLTVPIVTWGAAPFHRRAWALLRWGAAGLDTLVSISVLAGFGWSLDSLIVGDDGADGLGVGRPLELVRTTGEHHIYLAIPAGLTFLALVGHYLERRSEWADPPLCWRDADVTVLWTACRSDRTRRTDDQHTTDDHNRRAAVPLPDGRYQAHDDHADDATDPDPSSLHDTTHQRDRGARGSGDADRDAADHGDRGMAGPPRAGDRLAAKAPVLVVALAAGALGFWLAADDDVPAAVWAAVAVLVVACPPGLVLADALPFARAARRATELRIRLEDAAVPEAAKRVDTIVLDRQGTLTTGEPVLLDVVTVDEAPVDQLLQLVGSLGMRSQHPVLQAVAAAARARDLALDQADLVVDDPAVGAVRGVVRGRQVAVGDERSVAGGTRPLPDHIARTRAAAEQAGRLTLLVTWEESVRGLLLAVDPLRPGGAEAVDELAAQGVRPVLLTSDRRPVADAAAAAVGIGQVLAPIPPDGQAGAVRLLESQGRVVATVNRHGGQGSLHIARHVPDGSADLWGAAEGVHLARAAEWRARQNRWLAWACGVVALAVAAAGRLHPAAAMVAGAASVLAVAINSLRPARVPSVRLPARRRW